jgi:hypothetical protein
MPSNGLGDLAGSSNDSCQFLQVQADGLLACDVFIVETVGLTRLIAAWMRDHLIRLVG